LKEKVRRLLLSECVKPNCLCNSLDPFLRLRCFFNFQQETKIPPPPPSVSNDERLISPCESLGKSFDQPNLTDSFRFVSNLEIIRFPKQHCTYSQKFAFVQQPVKYYQSCIYSSKIVYDLHWRLIAHYKSDMITLCSLNKPWQKKPRHRKVIKNLSYIIASPARHLWLALLPFYISGPDIEAWPDCWVSAVFLPLPSLGRGRVAPPPIQESNCHKRIFGEIV